jgi:hypothetical protein
MTSSVTSQNTDLSCRGILYIELLRSIFSLIFQNTNNIQGIRMSHKENYVEFFSLAKFLYSKLGKTGNSCFLAFDRKTHLLIFIVSLVVCFTFGRQN